MNRCKGRTRRSYNKADQYENTPIFYIANNVRSRVNANVPHENTHHMNQSVIAMPIVIAVCTKTSNSSEKWAYYHAYPSQTNRPLTLRLQSTCTIWN